MTENKKIVYSLETKGVVDEAKRLLLGVVGSTGTKDRQGESINPMGWQIDNFKKNPVIMFGHDYHSFPVGKAVRTYIENNNLMFDIEFAKTKKAKEVLSLIRDKFLNAFSVGLIPKKWGVAGVDAYDIMEQELLELSVVPVPANPEALAYLKEFAPNVLKQITKEEEKPVEEVKQTEEVPATPTEEPTIADDTVVIDTPETIVEEKSGRILSKANENKLREVHKSIGDLLEQLDKKEVDTEVIPEDTPKVDEVETPEDKGNTTNNILKEMSDHFKKSDKDLGLGLKMLKDLKANLQVKN